MHTIRLATLADAPELARLRMDFFAEVRPDDLHHRELHDSTLAYLQDAIPRGDFLAALAESDGAIIATSGMIFYRNPPSPRNRSGRQAYIMNMYTLPPWRGRGIAAQLLTHLLDAARAKGCGRVVLHAMPQARPLYARAGFAPGDSEMTLTVSNQQ